MENSNKDYFNDDQSGRKWITQLFTRYFNGQSTEKEQKAIENWNPDSSKINYEATPQEIEAGCETVWQRLSDQFDFAIPKEQPKVVKKTRVIQLQQYVQYAAAAAVLLMGIGFYFYNNSKNSLDIVQPQAIAMEYFQSGTGEMKKMELPDGSVVYLNSDTKLGVATARFNKEKREIWLEEGEAFFEVAKNPEKPFIVHTSNLETTVKGTSFNVKAYKELDESSVSVRSGKVAVSNENNLIGELTKNKQITYNKLTGKIEQGESNWEDAAAWMDYRLVMKRASVKELKLRLKQQFGVDVILQNNALQGTLLNSSFEKNASLKEVLEVISVLYDVRYDTSKSGKVILSQ